MKPRSTTIVIQSYLENKFCYWMLVLERSVAPDNCLYDLCFEFFFVVSFFFTKRFFDFLHRLMMMMFFN